MYYCTMFYVFYCKFMRRRRDQLFYNIYIYINYDYGDFISPCFGILPKALALADEMHNIKGIIVYNNNFYYAVYLPKFFSVIYLFNSLFLDVCSKLFSLLNYKILYIKDLCLRIIGFKNRV